MKVNQGSMVEEAQNQLEVTRIDNKTLILQEENEAMKANQGSSCRGGSETTRGN